MEAQKKAKVKAKVKAQKKKQKGGNLLIPMLAFVKNMMNNPNKSEFEKHMKNNPKVHPDCLKYVKKHIGSKIEGPGLEKFTLFVLFHLGEYLKNPQKGGSGVDSNATTELEDNSESSGTKTELEGTTTELEEEDPGLPSTPEEKEDPGLPFTPEEKEQDVLEESKMNDDKMVVFEKDQRDKNKLALQGEEGEELVSQNQLDEYIDEEESKSNMIPNMLKFLWFAIFIGLVASIYKTTDDFINMKLDYKTPIFEALAEASVEYMPDNLKTLHELGEIVRDKKSENIENNLDLITFSTSTHTGGEFLNGLVVYEEPQEEPQDDTSENGKITIYGSDFELDKIILGYGSPDPITIKTVVSAVYNSDPSMVLDLYTTGVVALGAVSDTIQIKAMEKISEIPNKLIETVGDRLLNPNDPITLRSARLYSFMKSSYAFGFGSSIALKELRRTAEDIQTETTRYIQDIQRAANRAMQDKIEGFTRDVLSYINFLQYLLIMLVSLFLIPLYRKFTGKKIEDRQVSIEELENRKDSPVGIEDVKRSSDDNDMPSMEGIEDIN